MEQAGPAYEARVFLNNPHADVDTPRTTEHGYAGSFHVYGLGVPLPDKASIQKSVIATDAVRAAIKDSSQVTVTVVPVTGEDASDAEGGAMSFDSVGIVLK